jgi:predicted transcriptional regulator
LSIKPGLDEVDATILGLLEDMGPTTLSELARTTGWSKSMVWRRLRKLAGMGLVSLRRAGGALIAEPEEPRSPPPRVRVGILRASEYPYILPFTRRLRSLFHDVEVRVYDEARRLALDLASARVHLAMAPLVTLLLTHRLSGGRIHIIGGGSGGGAFIARGGGGAGHATTMASSMELCAELAGLPGPRRYASSGGELLRLLSGGEVEAAVLWEPYATRARLAGFEVEDCGLPVCCVLGAHRSLAPLYPRLSAMLGESVGDARRGAWDPEAYSRLTGLPRPEVEATAKRYVLLDEPPLGEAARLWAYIERSALPRHTLRDAFHA